MIKKFDDQELLNLFRKEKSKESAFELIIKKYEQKLYWLIRRYVNDHNDADDIMQEVFIKIWKGLVNFREDSQLYTWMFRIASNECVNFHRKQKKHAHLPIDEANEQEFVNKVGDNPMDGHQIQQKFQMAIDTLPEKQKMVFHLRYYQEMKYEEMSQLLGTSVGALKASFHIAIKKIEFYLTEH
jgi:RNA polymerase sigma-70 factor (ECF subfamily)